MASECHIGRRRDSFRLSSVLASAVFEWLLMLLLFLNAFFQFLVTKFARYCKLQTPCLLCSRLDHILGNEKPGFYRDLICRSHKEEISSLALCHVHQKLASINEMCENCLVSLEKKRDPEINLNGDGLYDELNGEGVVKVPLLRDPISGGLFTKYCSCCSVLFENNPQAVKLLQNNTDRVVASEFIHRNHQDRLNKKLELSLGSPSTHHLGNNGFDRLSRVGYSEVKVTSDSESENLSSDDDRCLKPEPSNIISNNLAMPLSDDTANSSKPKSPLLISEDQLPHLGESHDLSLASTVAIGHDLDEINWNKNEPRINPKEAVSLASEFMSQKDPSKSSDVKLNGSSNFNTYASTSDTDVLTNQITRDPAPSGTSNIDLNDAYKLAIGSKGSLTSPKEITEVITGRDSFRAYEDLRLLITQFSAARGLESPWNELSPSPRVQGQGDDFKFSDASSSAILQNITKSLSIDRNESGFDSLDGSIVSEIEGESPLDRMKRQVELDRKSMYLLYKELEEERSASAIAANQAMAMINKLQEEKAAMQMEALHYQRMMEEQSEYDQEALQRLNELLAEREKEMQDLEAELETYKKRKFDSSGDLLSGLENEKAYITDCLKILEKKLHLFSNNGIYNDASRIHIEEDEHLDKSRKDENGEANHIETLMPSYSDNGGHCLVDGKLSNVAALLNEVSRLNERLKALEADQNFLEHTVNTLRNGDDGIRFVQEIACHLQELRRNGSTRGEKSTA